MGEVSERRHVREHDRELREARAHSAWRAVAFGVAAGLCAMLVIASIGEYAWWPLVVWGTLLLGFGAAMTISVVEYMANMPAKEIVEIVEISAEIDEKSNRMIVSIGANSLGLSRMNLKPTQWQSLANALHESGLNFNRQVLINTGIWGNLTTGSAYPDLVKDLQRLGVVRGDWKDNGDLKSVELVLPMGWDEIQKMAGTDYSFDTPLPPSTSA